MKTNTTMMTNKLQAKDFINIGIYSALLMILFLVAGMTNLTPVTYLLYSPMTALLGAIPFMLATAKVPKKGAVLLFSIVPVLYFLLLAGAEGMIVAGFFVIFAGIAEIVLGNDRKDFKRLMISYIIFSCWNSIGGQFRLFVFTEQYLAFGKSAGLGESYIEFLETYANFGVWLIVIAVTVVAAAVGILIAKGIFKRHLERAGIV